jgi:hypothetical protein
MPTPRLNLSQIETSLRTVQREFHRINAALTTPRDPIGDDVLAHMLAGYAFVDRLVADRVDLFAMGSLKHLLEMNALVLCGSAERERYASHLVATERRFYDDREGGIRDLVEWMAGHPFRSAWRRAAGAYIRILSEPQLFIEGNHRAGALIMSYLLVRNGQPPFVLSVENAPGYFDPSTTIRRLRKRTLSMLVRLPGLQTRFAQFLRAQADASYLIPPTRCVT